MWMAGASFLARRKVNVWSLEKGLLQLKVLVTGWAEYVGSHVVDQYLDQGNEVVILDDLSTGRQSNLNAGAKFHKLAIRSPEMHHGAKVQATQH